MSEMSMGGIRLSGIVACLVLAGCAGKSAKSTPAAARAGNAKVQQLTSITVEDRGAGSAVILSGTARMSPNIFKLTDPDRIIIDLPETKLGSVPSSVDVGKKGINQITANQFDDAKNSLSRIVIGLTQPAEYQVESQDTKLVLAISAAAPSADASEAPAAATATQLSDIQYSSSASGTVVKLIGNGPIGKYQDFILKNPQRLVVDLPGVKNAYAGGKSLPVGTAEVSNLRLGISKKNVRVVLDIADSAPPAYTITRDGKALVLTLTSVASAETALQTEPPAPVTADPILITGVEFKQMPEAHKSRLIIGLSAPTSDYTVKETAPDKFTVSVAHSRLKNSAMKREFDAQEFQTSIRSVHPQANKKTGATDFAVELDKKVPYAVTQEGNSLFVDVETPEAAAVAAAKPVETFSEKSMAGVPELILEGDQATPADEQEPAKKTAKPAKDYRYVKEEFMSESMSSDEPLTEMGAILAGEYEGKRFTGRKISLDFKDADVRSIFRLIAEISKFNVIVSDDVEGRITIRLDDVPWDQAFAIILQTRGLWFEKYGNIVRIAPAEKLRKEKELAAAAAKAAKAAKPLDVLFKPVSFAQAATLTKQVSSVLSERGTVDIDSRTNTLIIKDIRENLDKAKRMVEILDTQTPQVTIESRIVEATTTFTRSFGIQWTGNARFTSATGNPTGAFFPNNVAVSPFAMNFPVEGGFINSTANISLGSINNILDLDLALALGEQEGHSKLISAPKVTVLDNKSATISAGSMIPFLTQTANAGSNVRFQSASTALTVTPHITNDGSILMNISATRSEPNFAQLVQGNPLIDERSANTEVLVKSGNTTVLGGIYSTQSGRSQNRMPFISSIPIIGALFRNYNKTLRRTELLIFVTPRIVGDEREAIRDIRE